MRPARSKFSGNSKASGDVSARPNSKRPSDEELDALVKRIVRQTLEREGLSEKSHISSKSYSDQPILQRGADWRKTHEQQDSKRGTRNAAGSTSTPASKKETYHNQTANRSTRSAQSTPKKAHAKSRGGRSGTTTKPDATSDLFSYYNNLLDREFGDPDAPERPIKAKSAASFGGAHRTRSSSANPTTYSNAASSRASYDNDSPVVFGGLGDFGASDDFEDPDTYDDVFSDPYVFSDYDDRWPEPSSSYGRASSQGDILGGMTASLGTSSKAETFTRGTYPQPHAKERWPYSAQGIFSHEKKVELPPTLKKLRDLEGSTNEEGEPLRGPQLFVAQAKLAADFEDDYQRPVAVGYHYLPTYAELNDAELRAYFTWRATWRHGTNASTPAPWAVLMAYEFIDGIGCEPGSEVVEHLLKLSNEVSATAQYGSWAGVVSDLRRWARDYVVYYDLDPKLLSESAEQDYSNAVMIYRRKERAVLVERGLVQLESNGEKPAAPSNDDLWNATKSLVNFDVDRSPFLRDYKEQAAAVWENVFTRMVVHCHKRRKVDYVDSLVGEAFAVPTSPFVGVPFVPTAELREHTVYLNAAEWISYRFGRWQHHYGYSYASPDPSLGKLVHALDREMREVWDYPRKLKEKKIPRYQQTYLIKACTEVHEEELAKQKAAEEAERRKIKFDFSKLGHIRAAAATTREALLVDEEREGYVPEGTTPQVEFGKAAADAGSTAVRSAKSEVNSIPSTTDTPTPQERSFALASPAIPQPKAAQPDATTPLPSGATQSTTEAQSQRGPKDDATSPTHAARPLGLTELEYQASLRMLEGKPLDRLLGPGAPSVDMLIDSINEKFFDELGDAAFEFGDNGPTAVEDYADDIRNLLDS